jgi:PEP-CTERM motif
MQMIRRFCLPVLALLVGVPVMRAGTVVFNFDSDPSGQATPFTDSSGGVLATFTSSGDPGGFGIAASFFETLTGQVLLDPGPAGLNNLTLSIVFSTTASAISMDFATNSMIGVPFDLAAYSGSTLVGTATATGSIPGGFTFPEGMITFNSASFDKVVLSAPDAVDFAIDNVSLTTGPAVPEPATAFLMVFGGVAILALARRRAAR